MGAAPGPGKAGAAWRGVGSGLQPAGVPGSGRRACVGSVWLGGHWERELFWNASRAHKQ